MKRCVESVCGGGGGEMRREWGWGGRGEAMHRECVSGGGSGGLKRCVRSVCLGGGGAGGVRRCA